MPKYEVKKVHSIQIIDLVDNKVVYSIDNPKTFKIEEKIPMVHIYTDGSCSGNGKENPIGGYGVVAVDDSDNILYESSEPIEINGTATNNRAELWAIVDALQWIEKESPAENYIIYSDSAYCVNMINQWMAGWARNNWIVPSTKKAPANFDLVQIIYNHMNFSSNITVQKVKGHADNKWNNYADKLAVEGTETARMISSPEYRVIEFDKL